MFGCSTLETVSNTLDPNELLTCEMGAAELKVSRTTFQRRIDDGTIPVYRYGPQVVRVRRSDLYAAGRQSLAASVAPEPEPVVLPVRRPRVARR